MTQKQSITEPLDTGVVISNTGPLISIFQSDSFELITQMFDKVWISDACHSELIEHGWANAIQAAGTKLVIVRLTADEKQAALLIAQQIALHPKTNDPVAENHLGEAQVIVVAQREQHQDDPLLLDELAARAVAKQYNVNLSGFPGMLLLAVEDKLISAEELKARLETCRAKGTHYGLSLIQRVYETAQSNRR